MNTPESTYQLRLEAVAFAARAHRHQVRKDKQTPYVSHVFRVCLIARHVFGVTDPRVLMAAALHDTVEDTNTDYDDLLEHFGADVAGWVATLSKDKRRQDHEREEAYKAALAQAPWPVQVCKLADIFDNLMDSAHTTPEQRAKTLRRSRDYLGALQANLQPEARPAFVTVKQLLDDLTVADERPGESTTKPV